MNHIFNHPRIEMIARDKFKPNNRNPRRHNDAQLRKIGANIQRFGFLVPLIVDDENNIIAGNARHAAAGLVGIDELPAIRTHFLSEADRRAFILAENKLSELGEWNADILTEELGFLFESDYNLDLTGFTLSDLDFSLDSTPAHPAEELIELPNADTVAVSRPGDLWIIGPHRLCCGDARDPASYETLLGSERAGLVFSDPPYNVAIDGHVSGNGEVTHREFMMASGEMSGPEFTYFLRSVFRCCAMFSTPASIHYHCMDWRHMREMLEASEGVYGYPKQLVVWNKDNGGQGAFYRSKHELIFVFKSGKGRHVNNFGLGDGGRYRTNIWDYAGANTFRKGRKADLADHPTVKPVAMIMDAIIDCSNRGDIVLDPFSGSGTTLIAAHKSGRRGAAIEIDPIYVDTALRRLTAASGMQPVHIDGRTFKEIAADREGNVHAKG